MMFPPLANPAIMGRVQHTKVAVGQAVGAASYTDITVPANRRWWLMSVCMLNCSETDNTHYCTIYPPGSGIAHYLGQVTVGQTTWSAFPNMVILFFRTGVMQVLPLDPGTKIRLGWSSIAAMSGGFDPYAILRYIEVAV